MRGRFLRIDQHREARASPGRPVEIEEEIVAAATDSEIGQIAVKGGVFVVVIVDGGDPADG